MAFIKGKLEKVGVHIFFISFAVFTQMNWARRKNSYDSFELRLFLATIVAIVLSELVLEMLRRVVSASKKYNTEDVLAKISFSLSPGFLLLFASKSIAFFYLGIGFCAFMILNNFLRPPKRFISTLEINDNMAEIKVEGTYVRGNSSALKAFLNDFILSLNECIETNVVKVKIDFSILEESDGKELKGMMDEVAKYFNLELSY